MTLAAVTAHGLFHGIQTIRQLLSVWIESPATARGPWTIPSVHIVDYPRYDYRGFMLDIARHFQTPETVMRLIDEAAAYKINTLHLHVSDDQGFRIVINGFPNLTEIGSRLGKDAIARTLVNPTAPMPSYAPFRKSNPEQFNKLVHYVASLKADE